MESIISEVNGMKFVNNESALDELEQNNCTMPNISRIIYNVGKKAYPKRDPNTNKILKDENNKIILDSPTDILATIVYFVDGTKVSVINSQNDGVKFENKTCSDGSTVKIATKESKECGLIYAIVKRLLSKPDANGKMFDSGLGRILTELVDEAYDSAYEAQELKIARAKSKAKYEAVKEAAKNNPPKVRYSIHGTLERINKLLDLAEAGNKDVLNKVVEAFKD